jgi:hypothetical protein
VNLAAVWSELESVEGDSGLARLRIYPDSHFELHLALELDTRRRQLRFARSWTPADELPPFPNMQGIRFRSAVQPDGSNLLLLIELLDPDLADLFTPVVEDLSARVAEAEDERSATLVLAEGLFRWQELFEALRQSGMGTLVRRGLAGELIVMRDMLLGVLAPEAVIACWTGPSKANQDFQRPAVAIEVKVTTGKQPQGFVVANERELDDTATGTLVVAHCSLDERQGGTGSSLNDLVTEVTTALTGHPLALVGFRERLARVGYLHMDSDFYVEPRYELRSLNLYQVATGFPRIVESDLMPGVGDVRYTVSLAACSQFLVSSDAVSALIAAEGGMSA